MYNCQFYLLLRCFQWPHLTFFLRSVRGGKMHCSKFLFCTVHIYACKSMLCLMRLFFFLKSNFKTMYSVCMICAWLFGTKASYTKETHWVQCEAGFIMRQTKRLGTRECVPSSFLPNPGVTTFWNHYKMQEIWACQSFVYDLLDM